MNRAPSPAASSGLTSAFNSELSPALNRALSPRLNSALIAGLNAPISVRLPCPAAPHARNFCESRRITAGLSACTSCVLSPFALRLLGKAAALLPHSKELTAIYM